MSGQQERTERTEIRQQGQTERTEARGAAVAEVADDWDGHHHYHDDEWGHALAGAAVGATVGYVAGGMNYYGCRNAWYNRSYMGGSVTYVTVVPPPSY